jgi:phosphocarrier protein
MVERKVTVAAEVGLHARPAATFVQAAKRAPMDISVCRLANGAKASGKSILQIMGLDVRQGEDIVISVDGEGTEGAEQVLEELAAIASAP